MTSYLFQTQLNTDLISRRILSFCVCCFSVAVFGLVACLGLLQTLSLPLLFELLLPDWFLFRLLFLFIIAIIVATCTREQQQIRMPVSA